MRKIILHSSNVEQMTRAVFDEAFTFVPHSSRRYQFPSLPRLSDSTRTPRNGENVHSELKIHCQRKRSCIYMPSGRLFLWFWAFTGLAIEDILRHRNSAQCTVVFVYTKDDHEVRRRWPPAYVELGDAGFGECRASNDASKLCRFRSQLRRNEIIRYNDSSTSCLTATGGETKFADGNSAGCLHNRVMPRPADGIEKLWWHWNTEFQACSMDMSYSQFQNCLSPWCVDCCFRW